MRVLAAVLLTLIVGVMVGVPISIFVGKIGFALGIAIAAWFVQRYGAFGPTGNGPIDIPTGAKYNEVFKDRP